MHRSSEPEGGGSMERARSLPEGAGTLKGLSLREAEYDGATSPTSSAQHRDSRQLSTVTPGASMPAGEGESPTSGSRTGTQSPSWDGDRGTGLDGNLMGPGASLHNLPASLSSLAGSRHDGEVTGIGRGGGSTSSQCDTTFSRSTSAVDGGAEVQVCVSVSASTHPTR